MEVGKKIEGWSIWPKQENIFNKVIPLFSITYFYLFTWTKLGMQASRIREKLIKLSHTICLFLIFTFDFALISLWEYSLHWSLIVKILYVLVLCLRFEILKYIKININCTCCWPNYIHHGRELYVKKNKEKVLWFMNLCLYTILMIWYLVWQISCLIYFSLVLLIRNFGTT